MNNTLKNIGKALLAGVCAVSGALLITTLCTAPKAHAQVVAPLGNPTFVFDGRTGKGIVAGQLTNYNNRVVDTTKGKDVIFQVDFKLTGAGTAPLRLIIEGNVGGTNWQTVAHCGVAANGTTLVKFQTNYAIAAMPYLRCSLSNGVPDQDVTNYAIYVYNK